MRLPRTASTAQAEATQSGKEILLVAILGTMPGDPVSQIYQAAIAQGINPDLALQVAIQESDLDPNAQSNAGAVGYFQLLPSTAAQLGVDPYDPDQNIQGGTAYLSQLLNQYGDPNAALAAYNWGPGHVSNAISQYGSSWFDNIPSEVQDYVMSILVNVPGFGAGTDGASVGDAVGGSSWGFWLVVGIGAFALWEIL